MSEEQLRADAPAWLWFGEDAKGDPVVTFGRWPKGGAKWRYKLAEIQPAEHDHPTSTKFEEVRCDKPTDCSWPECNCTPPPSEWKSMETAPKDGSAFLGVWWSNISVGEAPKAHIGICSWAGAWTPYDRKLTHWMPMPSTAGLTVQS
jgi:hypothetical protein